MSTKAVKKIPVRRCVGCGEGKPKKELVRITRKPDGEICLDPTGRMAGRGAYICKTPACLAKARKKNSLERAFKAQVPPQVYEKLEAELSGPDPDTGPAGEGGGGDG